MLLLSVSLILILAFAVHSATMDSEYWMVRTDNAHNEAEAEPVAGIDGVWKVRTSGALTWLNISVSDAPSGSIITIDSGGLSWWHHPSLGDPEAIGFNCIETSSAVIEVIERCKKASSHSIVLEDGDGVLRGLVEIDLPEEGVLTTRQKTEQDALVFAEAIVERADRNTTWTITLTDQEGDSIDGVGIGVEAQWTSHRVVSASVFAVDPVTELAWSVAALVGCFGLVLLLPLTVYLAARAKERRDEALRYVTAEEDE